MAWRSSGRTNDELVTNLLANHILQTPRVADAMRTIDRKHFAPIDAYADSPQALGSGATISAPHMHAYALESLHSYLRPGARALDVGSGSGYLTLCMARMTDCVVGIEHIERLVDSSSRVLESAYPELMERCEFVVGDGREGYARNAPYDCIHVGAACRERPQRLIEQLRAPGRLFAPVGEGEQRVMVYDKDVYGNVTESPLMSVVYVPLTDIESQTRDSVNAE